MPIAAALLTIACGGTPNSPSVSWHDVDLKLPEDAPEVFPGHLDGFFGALETAEFGAPVLE